MSYNKLMLDNIIEILSEVRTILKTALIDNKTNLVENKNEEYFYKKINEKISEYFKKANPIKFYKKTKF